MKFLFNNKTDQSITTVKLGGNMLNIPGQGYSLIDSSLLPEARKCVNTFKHLSIVTEQFINELSNLKKVTPAITVNSKDKVQVYDIVKESIKLIRSEEGTTCTNFVAPVYQGFDKVADLYLTFNPSTNTLNIQIDNPAIKIITEDKKINEVEDKVEDKKISEVENKTEDKKISEVEDEVEDINQMSLIFDGETLNEEPEETNIPSDLSKLNQEIINANDTDTLIESNSIPLSVQKLIKASSNITKKVTKKS